MAGGGGPLRFGCDDHWTWDRDARSDEVRLYEPHVAHFHPTWSSGTAAVRGTRILNNGRYYWELAVSQRVFGTSMMFGIGKSCARLHSNSFTNLLGEDDNSWGMSHKGYGVHNGSVFQFTRPFKENQATVVGLLFDGIAGTLTYYKDGYCLGVAFTGLDKIREPLYPMVASTAAKTEMTLVNMKRDFVNLQDRCRAVIVQNLKRQSQLDTLCLPPKLKQYITESIFTTSDKKYHRSYQVLDF